MRCNAYVWIITEGENICRRSVKRRLKRTMRGYLDVEKIGGGGGEITCRAVTVCPHTVNRNLLPGVPFLQRGAVQSAHKCQSGFGSQSCYSLAIYIYIYIWRKGYLQTKNCSTRVFERNIRNTTFGRWSGSENISK